MSYKLNCLAAIAGIVILDGIALMNGIDGVVFLTCVAILSGLGGVPVMDYFKQKVVPAIQSLAVEK